LANNIEKRIPGYIPCYGENTVSTGDQIILATGQRDCPNVVACNWTNRNDNLFNQAVTLFKLHVQQAPYVTSPCGNYAIINTSQSKDVIMPYLVVYFGRGVVFDPMDWSILTIPSKQCYYR
jgi:hypothetical protein